MDKNFIGMKKWICFFLYCWSKKNRLASWFHQSNGLHSLHWILMDQIGNRNYHQRMISSFEISWKTVDIIGWIIFYIILIGFRTPFGFLTVVLGVHCLPIIIYMIKYQVLFDWSPFLLYNVRNTCIIGRLLSLYCEVLHTKKKRKSDTYDCFFLTSIQVYVIRMFIIEELLE